MPLEQENWRWLALLPLAACVMPAHAVTYLSVVEARQLMFPGADRFVSVPEATLRRWQQALAKADDSDVRIRHVRLWQAWHGPQLLGYFATDAAVGRDEYFNFAIAFDAAAVITQVEILDYRESHGQEVHDHTPWRKQFIGKQATSALELDADIRNISGATLSCSHLTERIRTLTRLLHTGLYAAR